MTTLTRQDYANICSASYTKLEINTNNLQRLVSIPQNSSNKYYVHLKESDPKTGFQAYLLEKAGSSGQHTGEFITAFRGSDSFKDWEGNFHTLQTGEHPQTAMAMEFAKRARDEALHVSKSHNVPYSMVNTGHSLGGAFSQVAYLVNGATTITINPLSAKLLKDKDGQYFRFPKNAPIENNVMALDVASSITDLPGDTIFYSKAKDTIILKASGYHSQKIDNKPILVLAADSLTKSSHSLSHFVGNHSVLSNSKYVDKAFEHTDMIQEWRSNIRHQYQIEKDKNLFTVLEKGTRIFSGEYEGNDRKVREELKQQNQKQQQPIEQNHINNQKQSSIETLPPHAQKLIQQCEEKIVAYCQERDIKTTHPDDIKNASYALAAEAYKKRLDAIEFITINDKNMLNAINHQPHLKYASINIETAATQPIGTSIAQIQETAQYLTQQAQDKQITQSLQEEKRHIRS